MPIKQPFSDEIPTLNLTPMIDVLMLLIIFFMVGTKFIESEKAMSLQIPQVSDKAKALSEAPSKRVVMVYRDGTVSLDGKEVNLDQLTKRLAGARSQYKGLGVMVRGDADANFQRVASVLNACKQAGISDLGISVRLAKGDGPPRR
ncbi:MAG: biopolymer transporter ExbD [Pirellulaceae bacterium]|nr:biopolymer transporter ExbD [Pirellulaceae bacterium]